MQEKILMEINLFTREYNYLYKSSCEPHIFKSFHEKLKNGIEIRLSDQLPIICSMKYDYVSIIHPSEIGHWQTHSVVIPENGICEEGYVKEIWITTSCEEVLYDSKDHIFMNASMHNSDTWILGFITESPGIISLLPSKDIKAGYIDDRYLYKMVNSSKD